MRRRGWVGLVVVGVIAVAFAEQAGDGSVLSFVRSGTRVGAGLAIDGAGFVAARGRDFISVVARRYESDPERQERREQIAAQKNAAAAASAPSINLTITLDGKQIEGLSHRVEAQPQTTASSSSDSVNPGG